MMELERWEIMQQHDDVLKQQNQLDLAAKLFPGGVLGILPYPRSVRFIASHGKGPWLYDIAGRSYVDYVLGSGPLILGHAHPEVIEAVVRQVRKGVPFYTTTEPLIELGAELVHIVPCAEQIRFATTGTEANAQAIRLARAFTKKKLILRFQAGYVGHHDYGFVSPEKATSPSDPISAGIPEMVLRTVLLAPYNDLAKTLEIIEQSADDLAAVLIEPYQRGIAPADGFLKSLADACKQKGILLIFDEIVTGFWLSYGGAQVLYGVIPDLATFGKVIGGGHPLAAICGRAEILKLCDPALKGKGNYVYQGGTHCMNPIAATAGLMTLNILKRKGSYEQIELNRDLLLTGLQNIAKTKGFLVETSGAGGIFRFSITQDKTGSVGSVLSYKLLEHQINILPALRGFISLVHTKDEIDFTVERFGDALSELSSKGGVECNQRDQANNRVRR